MRWFAFSVYEFAQFNIFTPHVLPANFTCHYPTIMKKLLLYLITLFIPVLAIAQNSNWGWGPAITTSLSGTTLTCSAFDPVQNLTKTTSVTGVASFINNQGVVGYVTSGSTVGGLVYDINMNTWQQTVFSSNSGNTFQNSDGVIAWVSASGTVGGAIYDPIVKAWEYTNFSSNSGNTIQNSKGLVAWVSTAGTIGGAVYDPSLHLWRYTTFSSNSGNTFINSEGVIAWVSAAGTVGGAVYDPGPQVWKYTTFSSNSGNTIANATGVIGFISSSGTVGGAVYDHDQQQWKFATFSNSSGNSNVSVSNGTVYWNSSNGPQHWGYNFISKNWLSNYNTDLHCKLFVTNPSGSTPFITYFWCLSIGVNAYSTNCGDGHIITRRWGFKQYATAGNYNAELTIFTFNASTTCNQNVTVVTGLTDMQVENELNIYPNPAHNLIQFSGTRFTGVEIYNVYGALVQAKQFAEATPDVTVDVSEYASGVYFARLFDGNNFVAKKFMVE